MQLLTSKTIESFHNRFLNKFNFSEYKSIDESTVFLGLYNNNDVNNILNHRGIKILFLNGTDSTYSGKILKVCSENNLYIIAGSHWVEQDLKKLGVDFTTINLFLGDECSWSAEPLGNSIYWYGGNNSSYGKKYVKTIKQAFPDLNIIIHDNNTVPRSMMPEIYKQCFAGIRITDHDGMSQTVGEMGLMGRISIWNGDTSFSRSYKDVDNIINIIKELKNGYNYKLISKRTRSFFIENNRRFNRFILDVCGLNELDFTSIFDESIGRCGSIFRIQRKSDIDKIGGLGEAQFERPWFSEQMKKIGKKQLITSKNSDFIASEWKGGYNKGYPNNISYHTYDEKYK